jgi:hypothetical protein
MLSSLLGTQQPPEEPFPLEKKPGRVEPLALQHLRNGSNYLSPGGVLHTLRLPLQIVRGLLINLVLLMPWLLIAASLTGLAYLGSSIYHERSSSSPPIFFTLVPIFALVPLVMMIFLAPIIARWFRVVIGWKARNFLSLTMAALLGLSLLGLVLEPLQVIVTKALHASFYLDDDGGQFKWAILEPLGLSRVWQWGAVQKWGLAALAVLVAVSLVRPSPIVSKFLRQLTFVALRLLGPCLLLACYAVFCLLVPSAALPPQVEEHLKIAARLDGNPESRASATAEALKKWEELDNLLKHKDINLVNPCFSQDKPRAASWQIHPCPSSSGSADLSSQTYTLEKYEGLGFVIVYPDNGNVGPVSGLIGCMVLSGILLLLINLLYNVNYTSLHQFYRDRLSRLYLFRIRDGKVVPKDNLRLSELNEPGSAAPYHLLNVTLNLQGSSSPMLRGRKSDFFIFSKRYCGGPQTGYCPTVDMEEMDHRLDLGTAMATSAAAASPNMGMMNLESLRCLMALLNIRLGYWAPNPRHMPQSRSVRRILARLRFKFGPGSGFLLRETFGSVDASSKYVNLSDGGHLENLGVYELLRRRCKAVVAIDGEADPRMTFPSLHALMRYAWIDLGIRIELKDLGSLRLKDGMSSRHFAIGTIDYGEEGTGVFVYIKASVTGDEHPLTAHYQEEHPKFPHESTADQFFNEHQFESYRELGEHIGNQLVKEEAFQALFQARPPFPPDELHSVAVAPIPSAIPRAAAALAGDVPGASVIHGRWP